MGILKVVDLMCALSEQLLLGCAYRKKYQDFIVS